MDDRVDRRPGMTGMESPSMSEWTRSEARDLADAARERTQDAKTYATEAKDYVQGAVRQTREYVEDAVQQARDKVDEYRAGGMERMKDDMVDYTRQQPMTALLLAAGAGLLLGWISAAGRR